MSEQNSGTPFTNSEEEEEELNAINLELAEVEQGLEARRQGGQAAFNSVQDALGSIRSRLDHIVPSDAVTTDRRGLGSLFRSLSERLRTADQSHSSRVPLRLLRGSNVERRRKSMLSRSAPVKSERRGEAAVAEASKKKSRDDDVHPHDPPQSTTVNQRRLLFSRERPPSNIVASRTRADQVEGFEVILDVDGVGPTPDGGLSLLSPVVESSDRKSSSTLSKDDRKESDSSSDPIMKIDDEPETPLLLTNSCRNKLLLSSSYLPGSVHLSPKSSTVVYSWGLGPHSLHDDTDDKTVDQSRLISDSRLNRVSVLSVATSQSHTACATAQGEVLICGLNNQGCVDPDRRDEDIIGRPTKLESLGTTQIVQVSCGLDHTAALAKNGSVLTWGSNKEGQLGHRPPFGSSDNNATGFCRPQGMVLTGGRRAAAVACGHKFTLVLTTRMSVLCVGSGLGEIATSSNDKSHRTLTSLPALEGLPLIAVTAGDEHAVVLTAHGSAFAFGNNKSGCCGRPFPHYLSVPVPFHVPDSEHTPPPGPHPFPNWAMYQDGQSLSIADDVAIVNAACGDQHTVLVTKSGRLLVCGSNDKGQLGLDSSKDSISPVKPVNHPEHDLGRRFVTAEAGFGHTLLLDDVGDVWQMGTVGKSMVVAAGPQRVLKGQNILTIAAGGNESIAVAAGSDDLRRRFSVSSDALGVDGNMLVESLENLQEAVLKEEKSMGDVDQITDSGQELANRTEELLKYPAVLNSLFLDPETQHNMYEKLVSTGGPKLKQCIAKAIERGMKIGLEKLRSDNSRMLYPEAVRCLLLYIKFFDREHDGEVVFDKFGDCIMSFCETMLGLPFEGYKALLTWATTIYPGNLFAKMLVRPLVVQLNKGLNVKTDDNGVDHNSKTRRAVPVIVAVLQWLQKASEKAGGIAKPEDFESTEIGKIEPYTLYQDLARLKKANKKQRSSHFFLCSNPFLFSPGCKRNLLQIESQVEMVKTATSDVTFDSEQEEYKIKPFFVLEIEREHLLEQTLEKIKETPSKELRKSLRVVFKGEKGIDAGGVTKEFFQLLSEELFDVNSGLWSNRFGDQITWFNSDCDWDDEGYELAGVLVGLALYNSVLLDAHFPIAVYRMVLGLSLGIEDMVDKELRKGLQQLLDYDGDDAEYVFCLNFEVTWSDDLGEEQTIELKPGGSDIPVTTDNREEYVLLYTKWLLVDSIRPQWVAFERGLMRIMESSSLDLFRPEELQLLVVGTPELDFSALETNTEYEGGYDKDSEVIRNFWRFVQTADHDTQIKFLKFATASTHAPIGGLGKMPFKIQRAGPDSPQLPTSHTCFNTLLIPDYGSDYDKLSERLGRAILECEGFGLE